MKTSRTTKTDPYRSAVLCQGLASLAMLKDCLAKCPDEHWDGVVGTYPFWMVAYHTLCYADCYCARTNEAWKPSAKFHPKGRAELSEEFPSRRFERAELLAYLAKCRTILRTSLAGETPKSLAGPSGFSWLQMPRAELYLYNVRHVQHHTGQLTAFLRRVGVQTSWSKRVGR